MKSEDSKQAQCQQGCVDLLPTFTRATSRLQLQKQQTIAVTYLVVRAETSEARISTAVASDRFRSTAENKEKRWASWRARSSRLCGFCRRRLPRRSSGQHPNTRPCVGAATAAGQGYLLGATLQPTRAPGRQDPAARCPSHRESSKTTKEGSGLYGLGERRQSRYMTRVCRA